MGSPSLRMTRVVWMSVVWSGARVLGVRVLTNAATGRREMEFRGGEGAFPNEIGERGAGRCPRSYERGYGEEEERGGICVLKLSTVGFHPIA
jgi:hypothetical protein